MEPERKKCPLVHWVTGNSGWWRQHHFHTGISFQILHPRVTSDISDICMWLTRAGYITIVLLMEWRVVTCHVPGKRKLTRPVDIYCLSQKPVGMKWMKRPWEFSYKRNSLEVFVVVYLYECLLTYLCVNHVHAWDLQWSESGVRWLGTEVTNCFWDFT